MKYYTSDLRVDHHNIMKYQDRPFDNVDEMRSGIIENWNRKIHDSDSVYILGNTCSSKKEFKSLMNELNGKKYVLIGDHDAKGVQNMNLANVIFCPLIYQIKDRKSDVVLCHFPIYEWPVCSKKTYHLHGHTHGSIGINYKECAFDVGTDLWNYEPVSLEEILSLDNTRNK